MDHDKIDSNGRYLPIFGYSIISMCEITPKLAELYDVFKASRIAKYFQPLPLDSYHMTVYNIWYEAEPFYPYMVKLANGATPVKDADAMNKLMKPALDKMSEKINTYSSFEKMKLNNFKVVTNPNSITIYVDIKDPEQNSDIQSLRQWCGEQFDKTDADLRFHVTLGYLFKEITSDLIEDISQFQKWVDENLTDFLVEKPLPMCFRSMEKFVPYTLVYNN